jgi:hypothetical protein
LRDGAGQRGGELEEGAVVTAYFNADRVIIATLC